MSQTVFCTKLNKLKLIQLGRILNPSHHRYATETSGAAEDAYTKEPVYPEILNLSYKSRKVRTTVAWHEEVKNLNTVEEKLIKINIPRYYGFKNHIMNDYEFRYNCLPYMQHWTRTKFEEGIPPAYYEKTSEEENQLINEVKGLIEDAVVFQHQGYRNGLNQIEDRKQRDRALSLKICSDINRVLLSTLSPRTKHLNEVELDVEPRHEAFWFVGGIEPSKLLVYRRRADARHRDCLMDPVDRPFQYTGKPLLALRNRLPLEPVFDINDSTVQSSAENLPFSKLDPRTIGHPVEYAHGRTIPGFWPGSQHQFGTLSYHDRRHMIHRNPDYGKEDDQCALHTQGILTSYAWLLGQACYQGFSTYNDITYPLVTQTIISNGKYWSFYLYQLNTTVMHCEAVHTNQKANQCWGTKELKLYEEIDSNGKLVGFNDEVVRHLIQFYTKPTKQREHEMRPYLGTEEQTVADIEDVPRREFLERQFKHIFSRRPRHRLDPEIYDWERIYKIDNETIPMAPRRRFFEKEIDPWKRRLDEHHPRYIPKVTRPGGPKSKPKWETNYWP